ncbi:MAG: hypothetical protein EKK55_06945 [Rhodocyclaceae bacterium]|nr:MAG: hypothetical protein EKK55_06945 [Rhodocyclaceae bacterium]
MDAVRKMVFETLSQFARGTLLFVDYVPAHPRDAAGARAMAHSIAQGIDEHHYYGELVGVEVVGGDPCLKMKVHNRDGELRRFNPFKGKLNDIQPLTAELITKMAAKAAAAKAARAAQKAAA